MTQNNKEINRLTISRHDFEKCNEFLNALSSTQYGSILYEALLISAIIFYGRPFSRNEFKEIKATSSVDKIILQDLSQEQLKFHEMILKLRNKAVAHAEWNYHPVGVTKNGVIQSRPFSIWEYFQGENKVKEFKAITDKLINLTHNLTVDKLNQFP